MLQEWELLLRATQLQLEYFQWLESLYGACEASLSPQVTEGFCVKPCCQMQLARVNAQRVRVR